MEVNRSTKLAFLLIIGIAPFCKAQMVSGGPQTLQISNFGGLDDTDNPSTLQPNEAQSLLNVEANFTDTAIMKRGGLVSQTTPVLSTVAINGLYYFIDKNSNQQIILCQGCYCEASTNGGVFTTLTSTENAKTLRWSFVDYNGSVYAVDDQGDQPWSWDGTTFTQPFSTSAPTTPTLIELTKDRLVLSGVSTNPSSVYYSQSGNITNFTIGSISASPWTDIIGTDGDKITALHYNNGNLYLFKRQGITSCQPSDQFSTTCYPISSTIGTNSPNSVTDGPDGIYFQSQNGEFWRIPVWGIYGIELISRKISNFVKSQPNQNGSSSGSNLQHTQTDWNNGTQYPAASWNTQNIPGSVMNSSWTATDLFTTYTSSVNISTYIAPGNLELNYSSNSISNGNFGTGDFTNWTNNGFVLTTGGIGDSCVSPSGSSAYPPVTGNSSLTATLALMNGSTSLRTCTVTVNCQYDNTQVGGCQYSCDAASSTCDYFQAASVSLSKKSLAGFTLSQAEKNDYQLAIKITDSVSGDTLQTQSTFTANTMGVFISDAGLGGQCATPCPCGTPKTSEFAVQACNVPQYISSGTFLSQSFNTAFSTPVWGNFTSEISSGSSNNLSLSVQSSSNNINWYSLVSQSANAVIVATTTQYIRYQAVLTNSSSSKTPIMPNPILNAATTGQFATQCIQPGSNISSWGTLSCSNSNTGAGAEVFYATSAATCAGLTGQTPIQSRWTSQTNNAALTISTNAAMEIGWVDTLTTSTDTAQINSCNLAWNNGTTPQSVWGQYNPTNNAIYWTTSNANNGINNRTIKYDLNLAWKQVDPWFIFDTSGTALKFVNNSIYMGESNTGRWDLFGSNTNPSDNGAAINAYWQSKNFSCNAPYQDSSWYHTFAIVKNQASGSGNLSDTFTDSLGDSDLFSISQSTTSTLPYVRAIHALQSFSPTPFMNLEFSNATAGTGWEVDGFGATCQPNPLIPENP